MFRLLVGMGVVALFCGCAQMGARAPLDGRRGVVSPDADVPPVPREARGVWVATVDNIDWPSKPGLSTKQQQDELRAILDQAAALNLNIIVLQVRPTADAFYASRLEPWSSFLTGEQGRPPKPFYDPLEFAVNEAHARGMELHAWLNPFRAQHPANRTLAANHVAKSHPEWVREYGEFLWLDPGVPAARAHSLAVVRDVVQRYDLDGIHVDDYFYPYPVRGEVGGTIPFPDDDSWATYQAGGGTRSRDDWRRDNINRFMKAMYADVKRVKPYVKVGISPFGIWRPGHPPQIEGFDACEGLYADSKVWLQEGWLDYLTPQLYWRIDPPAQSYPVLLQWWIGENTQGRAVWPGNFISRVDDGDRGWPVSEVTNQINLTRATDGAGGNIFFSMQALMSNKARLADHIGHLYATSALVPAMPWLDDQAPPAPVVNVKRGRVGELSLVMEPGEGESAMWWTVQVQYGRAWRLSIVPATSRTVIVPGEWNGRPAQQIVVRAADRCGNLSTPAIVR